jgi:CheY-like chemotaxis protein
VLAVTGAAAIMERQLRQMVRLIDDLLDVSRIARGKLKLHMEPVALQPIIDAAVETVRPKLLLKRQAFSCRLPEAPVVVRADAARLSQVIANVLHNASKYTPPEGRIALQARVVPEERTIEIDVTDTGMGIPADALPGLFTMFSQVERADGAADGPGAGPAGEPAAAGTPRNGAQDHAAQEHDGLGIGLALARSLVELHGGTIQASSDGPGRGARFALRLPLSAAAPAGARVAAVTRPPPPRRVLVVDDNQDSADSLAAMLRLDGHEVSVAYAGEAAIALAERLRPEVILLDIGLPDIDGHAVARRLRERERAGAAAQPKDAARQARIVALSGYGQAADRQLSLAAGCDGHLVKPVSHDELAGWLDPGRESG